MTVIIDNNTVSQNMQETLPIILLMVEPNEFPKYDSMTAAVLGYLANDEDAIKHLELQIDAIAAGQPQTSSILSWRCGSAPC